jgi:hypothetical protein
MKHNTKFQIPGIEKNFTFVVVEELREEELRNDVGAGLYSWISKIGIENWKYLIYSRNYVGIEELSKTFPDGKIARTAFGVGAFLCFDTRDILETISLICETAIED